MMLQVIKNYVETWRYQIFYFTFYAGYMPLLLYIPVYLRHVGLTTAQVGIINAMRPILQSLFTPLLVIVVEKLRAKKLLFVLSCLIAISKILIMFLLIRPQRQLCIVSYLNNSSGEANVVKTDSKLVHVSLLVTDNWSEEKNTLEKRIAKKDNDFNKPTTTSYLLGEYSVTWSKAGGNMFNLSTGDFTRTWVHERQPVETSVKRNQDTRVTFDILYNKHVVDRIFVALVFLTIVADPFVSSIFTLVDYSCAASTDIGQGYREVRLWETIGWGTMTPIIGLVIYELRTKMCGMMVETFHYVFFFHIGFVLIALLIGTQIDFTQKIPEVISSKVHSAHSNLQYGMFSIISAFAGFGHGFLLTFVNWFIDSLGGTTVTMGVATASKSIVDIILYFQLGTLIEKLGYVYTVCVGLAGHIVAFFVYYGITNAWLVILAEVLYAFVYGSLMSTCASFLVNAAPAGSSARMQAIYHGIYWGVGTSAGCILSGYRLHTTGFPTTFLTFACITAIVSFIFLAVQVQMFLKRDIMDRSSTLSEYSDPEEWDSEN